MNFGPDVLDEKFKELGSTIGANSVGEYLTAGRGIVRNATNVYAKVNEDADGKETF